VDIINKNLLPFRIAIGGEVSIACRNYQLMLSGFDEMKIQYASYEYTGGPPDRSGGTISIILHHF
jgi:hypothetical protein